MATPKFSQNFKTISLILIGALIMYLFASLVVAERMSEARATLAALVGAQEERLVSAAASTARNQPDPTIAEIVVVCPAQERERFNILLGQLDSGLPRVELLELQSLFSRCGDYHAIHKTVMANKLVEEVRVFSQLVSSYESIFQDEDSRLASLETWERLASAEREESIAYATLVSLQEEIITALINGATIESEEISEILSRVSETQTTLANTNIETAELRTKLGL